MKVERHDAVTTYDICGLTYAQIRTILDHLHRNRECGPGDICGQAEDLYSELSDKVDHP